MRRFRGFNHSTCKTVLNLLETVYLRLRKIVVERVTVVKFRVDNRGSNGTGCFRIKIRTDTAELTNMRCSVTYLAKNMVQYNVMSNRN